MARIRSIKPEFFRNRRLYLAELETGLPLRLGFAGLWVCADREGRFKWEPEELKLDALPWDDVDFTALMIELEKLDAVRSYEVDGRKYGYIPAWKLHQIINNREADSTLPEPPDFAGKPGGSDACPTRAPRVPHASQGEGKGKEGNTDASRTRRVNAHGCSVDFEEALALYPRREGGNSKADAWRQWQARVRQGIEPDEMREGIRRYATFVRAKGKEGTEFVKQAATFLGPALHFREPWALNGAAGPAATPTRPIGAVL